MSSLMGPLRQGRDSQKRMDRAQRGESGEPLGQGVDREASCQLPGNWAEAGALGAESRGSELGSGETRTIFPILVSGSSWITLRRGERRCSPRKPLVLPGAEEARGGGREGFCRKMHLRRTVQQNPGRQEEQVQIGVELCTRNGRSSSEWEACQEAAPFPV